MSLNFMVDVETLDVESTAVILSAAIVYFDPSDPNVTFEELVERSLYVKLNAREQLENGRSKSKSTVEWWMKQGQDIQDLCLKPSPKDLSVEEALRRMREYVDANGSKDSFFWARGSLDQMSLESLARKFDQPFFADYNAWMDVRTAIRLIKETAKWTGYCDIPDFNRDLVNKHNPIDDIALDVLQLVKGV